ncbi:hypothetical protein BDA99DRAFT_506031 [Phascolomyces articulosus]|uniref:Uncharacterized protein n=1 Tax=Phascolomyces articulosus TaxID=60185 RepID=A0AAD5PEV1_9FUNG|nr:hypothetical protein BDA99DRAFT_506031 [Phascolomyces articulosus]
MVDPIRIIVFFVFFLFSFISIHHRMQYLLRVNREGSKTVLSSALQSSSPPDSPPVYRTLIFTEAWIVGLCALTAKSRAWTPRIFFLFFSHHALSYLSLWYLLVTINTYWYS